ncbi:FadR/GntR family transcriptional regulator [Noviherbaspirillum aerium]|uniref:FadR/GntR family transcriptional regulator n=1 Tax=Noviherbaspirillum aerium TaxID=2588497 RepID=UPI00178C1D9E|nr:FadR/GntR family transcriptional regulator [Noviherbaspirillum aerium]
MDTIDSLEPRKPVTQLIADRITSWITSGRYKAGDHLPSEGDLAKQLGVSKPSVRESLRQLVAFGVIEINHGRPPTVRSLSSAPLISFFHLALSEEQEGLKEAIELRRALEAQSVILATERATDEDIEHLGQIIDRLNQCKDDYEKWVPEHVGFHLALVKASHNRFFSFLVDALQETIEKTNRMILAAQPNRNATVTLARHVAIYEAVKSRDVNKARQAVEQHFEAVDKVVSVAFDKG